MTKNFTYTCLALLIAGTVSSVRAQNTSGGKTTASGSAATALSPNEYHALSDGSATAPSLSFTFTMPSGWRLINFPGLRYPVVATAPVNSFAPNINVVTEDAPVSLAEYVQKSDATLKAQTPPYKIERESSFVTGRGLKGHRTVARWTRNSTNLRYLFYIWEGKNNRKYVVTFTALASEGAKYDTKVDAAMQSFRFLSAK